jgi:hypothetical protein
MSVDIASRPRARESPALHEPVEAIGHGFEVPADHGHHVVEVSPGLGVHASI